MFEIIDFSDSKLSSRNLEYGGRDSRKKGILYKNEYWFLKFQNNHFSNKKTHNLSSQNYPLSEYLGCHVFNILGYKAQKTLLGVYFNSKENILVSACKDFIKDDTNELFIPYKYLKNDTNYLLKEKLAALNAYPESIQETLLQLSYNTILQSIPLVKEKFWEIVIIDLLINNLNRTDEDCGLIKYKDKSQYKLAPIFDCGNSFYGNISEEDFTYLLKDEKLLINTALEGITTFKDNNGKYISLVEFFSLNIEEIQSSKSKIRTLINNKLDKIISFFNSIPTYYKDISIMSDQRKAYYIATLKIRVEKLLNDNLIKIFDFN